MSFCRAFLTVLLLSAFVSPAVNPPTQTSGKAALRHPAPPSIIIITLDTTRADRMGFLGSKLGLTANLDQLARDGVVFTKTYSHVPLTPPSHAAILSGTYPQFNHVNDFGARLGSDVPYLPDILRARGYRTAAFVSSIILDPVQGSGPGFDRGFDTYDAGFHRRLPGQDRYSSIERRAGTVVSHALAWLDKHPKGPYFLWLHLYDAHDPYDPPEPFKTRYASALYDGEIAYLDSALGKFFSQLRARGLYDSSTIAVMADHGEGLGDHGETAHGIFLYDETIHVPLVFKFPKNRGAGKRVDARAGLVDVAPTLLEAVGIPVPKLMQGESLVGLITAAHSTGSSAGISDRPQFAETDYPRKAFGWSAVQSWRTGKYLFVQAPRKELYDQATDPRANSNLATTSTAVTAALSSQLNEFRKKTSSANAAPKGAVDPEAQEKLSALGYVASGADDSKAQGDDVQVGPGILDTGADPKDKVEVANLLHDAILAAEETRYEQAIPLLKRVLTTDPGIPIAYMELGSDYTWLKRYHEAIPPLRKAVEMRPDALMPQYELGLALSETGDWEGALPHFQAAVEKSPKWGALHFSLAAAYGHVGRMDDARKELETTLKLNPDDFRANLVFGRMLALQGKPAQGLPNLKKALKLQPNDINVHLFLADAYEQLGQLTNARRERALAERMRRPGGP